MALKQCIVLIVLACLALSASGQTNQDVLPAASTNQSDSTPPQQYQAAGASTPTICAEGDLTCSAALVQPLNDSGYTNCVVSPSAPNCTASQQGAATESAANPEDSCPTSSILDQGISEAELETQVKGRFTCINYTPLVLNLRDLSVFCLTPQGHRLRLAGCSLCQRRASRPRRFCLPIPLRLFRMASRCDLSCTWTFDLCWHRWSTGARSVRLLPVSSICTVLGLQKVCWMLLTIAHLQDCY